MPIVRKLVAHNNNKDAQWLKVDHNSKFIQNDCKKWQFLFGPNSVLNKGQRVIKIAAEFDKINLNSIYFTAYLYDPVGPGVDSAGSCDFKFYKITNPNWSETLIYSTPGTMLSNSHFYVNVPLNLLPTVDFEGGDVFMVEATIIRLGKTYRDRVYVNHLGVYDSIIRLRNEVEFLDVTKLDE